MWLPLYYSNSNTFVPTKAECVVVYYTILFTKKQANKVNFKKQFLK